MTRQEILQTPPERLPFILSEFDDSTTLREWINRQSPEGKWEAFLFCVVNMEEKERKGGSLMKFLSQYSQWGSN